LGILYFRTPAITIALKFSPDDISANHRYWNDGKAKKKNLKQDFFLLVTTPKTHVSKTQMSNNNQRGVLYQTEAINVNDFVYTQPYPNPTQTINNIYMNLNNTRPKIQSPLLYCPFGISVMVDEKKKDAEPGFSIDLQLGNENPKTEAFTKWLDGLDSKVFNDGKNNAEKWLPSKKKLTDRMAKELFKPAIKKFFDKTPGVLKYTDKYPARCKFKIQRKNGKFVTKFFDHNRQPLDLSNMTAEQLKAFKGNRCRVIFEIAGVWAGAKGFGVTLRADQIMFYPPQRLTGFGFVDDVEDELIFGGGSSAAAAAAPNSVEPAGDADPVGGNSDEDEPIAAAPENETNDVPQAEAEEVNNEEEEEKTTEDEEPVDEEPVAVAPNSKGKIAFSVAPPAEPAAKQSTLAKYSRAKKTADPKKK
jgi:hypothetical protein